MTPFAAVLLTGGRSHRMGRDKALLPLPDGHLLWERQLEVLRALEPARLFVSGPRRPGFPADLTCLEDGLPAQGPLGGIVVTLRAMAPLRWLVVLAVDLPHMTPGYLSDLLSQSGPGQGTVPRWADGSCEPLAAVYSVECLPLAEARLKRGQRALTGLVEAAHDYLRPRVIQPHEHFLFTNWNTPDDAGLA